MLEGGWLPLADPVPYSHRQTAPPTCYLNSSTPSLNFIPPQASPLTVYCYYSILTCSHTLVEDDHPVEDNLEAHVLSKEFDEECAAFAKCRSSSSDDSDTDSDVNSLWTNDTTSSSVSTVEPSPYDVPRLEVYLYYAGVSGPNGHGLKLVYRTTREKENLSRPLALRSTRRLMKLHTVPENHKLCEDNLWDDIRTEVRGVLEAQ